MRPFALVLVMSLLGIIVVLAIGCPRAHAGETWAVASLRSYHFERRGQNERNPGLGIERELAPRWRLVAGGYENSSHDASFYAGAVYAPLARGDARLGVLGAAVSGYEDKPSAMVAAIVMLEGRRFGVNLGLIPAAGGVLFLQAKVRWD